MLVVVAVWLRPPHEEWDTFAHNDAVVQKLFPNLLDDLSFINHIPLLAFNKTLLELLCCSEVFRSRPS